MFNKVHVRILQRTDIKGWLITWFMLTSISLLWFYVNRETRPHLAVIALAAMIAIGAARFLRLFQPVRMATGLCAVAFMTTVVGISTIANTLLAAADPSANVGCLIAGIAAAAWAAVIALRHGLTDRPDWPVVVALPILQCALFVPLMSF